MNKKRLLPLIISLLIIPAAGCFERNDMYTLAKNGIPLVYAINSAGNTIYAASDKGLVYTYTFTPASVNSILGLAVLDSNKIVAVISNGGNSDFYTIDKESGEVIGNYSETGTACSFTVIIDQLYYILGTNIIRTYNVTSSQQFADINTALGGFTAQKLTQYNGNLYVVDNSSMRKIYKCYSGTATDTGTGHYSTGTSLIYFTISEGKFIAGYTDSFITGNLNEDITLTPVSVSSILAYTSYGSDIYSVTSSTNFIISKLVSGVFTNIATVTGTGSISIGVMNSNTMAVGNSSGLHFLDLSTGILTTVATDSISAIYVEH